MKQNATIKSKDHQGSFKYLLFISIVAACGGLLFGYDAVVVSGTNSQVMNQFNFTTFEMGFYVSCVLWGCALGSAVAGGFADRHGRKIVLLASAISIFFSAFWSGFAGGHVTLILARLLGGLGIGAATTVCPLYISEISPEKYRGRLVTLFQLTITIGIVLCVFSNWGIFSFADANTSSTSLSSFVRWFAVEENWRLMFFVEALPGVLFMVCALFIPESPRWLVKMNREADAKVVLARINGDKRATDICNEIKTTLDKESSIKFKDLFTKRLSKPMILALLICVLSEACGCSVVFYYGPMIFEEAGFQLGDSLGGFAIIAIVNFFATLLAIAFIDKIGRRKLLMIGASGSMISMIMIGGLMANNVSGWLVVIAINLFIGFFACALGPVKFVVMSEIFPNRVRGVAIAFCTFCTYATSAIVAQIFPVIQASTPAGTIYYMFAVELLVLIMVVKFLMPETKNRTIEEIESSWFKNN